LCDFTKELQLSPVKKNLIAKYKTWIVCMTLYSWTYEHCNHFFRIGYWYDCL